MTIFDSILCDAEALDLRLLSDSDRVGASRNIPGSNGQLVQRVLALTLRQLTEVALLICASASIVNWLNRNACEDTSATRLLVQLPGVPTLDVEASRVLVQSDIPIELIMEFRGFTCALQRCVQCRRHFATVRLS